MAGGTLLVRDEVSTKVSTGAGVGSTGAEVGATGAGVGATGAEVGATGAGVDAIGAEVGATGADVISGMGASMIPISSCLIQ